jgi:capsular exopolysaccharide synthesis family protein
MEKMESILSENYYQYLTDYLLKNQNLDQVILPTSMDIKDGILSGFIAQLVQLQMDLKLLKPSEKENPRIGDYRKRIDEIKKDIKESIQTLRATDKIKNDYLARQIKDAERDLNRLPLAERDLISIQRNNGLLEKLFVYLLQRRSEASITMAANTSDVIIVNPPVAGAAISPNQARNYIISVVVGLAFPLAIFFLLELFNTRVQSREDIEKFTSIPFIGGVGHKRTASNLEVLNSPKTIIAESFRALRSNLNYFLGKRDKVVIVITSSISGEGKTFTSINLASVLALAGKRVLIIGADLRKPKIYIDFKCSNEVGLSTYLSGMNSIAEIIQKTSYANLDMVSGGPIPPNPGELLLAPALENFILQVRNDYDYVVIDTPPIAVVADAFALIPYADHTLFLIRQNYTPKDLLRTIQDFYKSGKLKNISVVLNDIYRSGPGYGYGYGYNYGYGYSYLNKKTSGGYYSE